MSDNPFELAMADQELATIDEMLNALIELWLKCQDEYTDIHYDRTMRISDFMGYLMRHPDVGMTGAGFIAVAIERLAKGGQ